MHRNPGGLPLGFRDVHVELFFLNVKKRKNDPQMTKMEHK